MLSHHLNCKVNFESILPCISREKKYHGDFLEEHCFVYSRSGSLDTKPSASSWTTDRSYSPVVFVLWPHAWALGNGRWSEELIGTTFQTSLKEMSLLNVPCYFQEKKKKKASYDFKWICVESTDQIWESYQLNSMNLSICI